ncbi:hypothetical protein Agub_g13242 [Astrephomene gubernaculifera]|uniref:Uncharacterized protein n=1 Tax=Astrephomene gubernaculifera TaxID=47775 RepID=A0AAD3DZX5_9CHLO|nr:hypothetical protein Agub_g13242 [Astrephomene gubernaculifera]
MRPREPLLLGRWREASRRTATTSRELSSLFTEYLALGGPETIKSLQATIRKLQAQVDEQKSDGRLDRYRKLQKDLEESDKVCDCLRAALKACQWSDEEVDAHIQKKLYKASTLYGASREMLLRENRLLRSQLEEHLVTSRTSRPASGARPAVSDSKLKQAHMHRGPHFEAVARLTEVADALDAAERAYQLPSVCHAEVQVDDGSAQHMRTMQQQLAAVTGQKLQLMQQLSSAAEQSRLLDLKLEGALEQLAEMRRQKTEMLAHQDNLSKDLREHLLSESKRADTAEVALADARQAAQAAREAEAAARQNMERALAEAQAAQAALQEKAQQVDTLRGVYLELRETLEALAGDVSSGQQEAARRLLEATREQFADQRVILEDVKATAVGVHRVAQHSADAVTQLTVQQRVLAAELARTHEASSVTLGAYERQLGGMQQQLQQSEAERARLTRQALAASALSRIEDKRHQQALHTLLSEVPRSVVRQLGPRLQALAEGTQLVAQQVERTQQVLEDSSSLVGAGAGKAGSMLQPPPAPDVVDDASSQLLAQSRLLRAQLHGLSAGIGPADRADGPGPAQAHTALAHAYLLDSHQPFQPAHANAGETLVDPAALMWMPPGAAPVGDSTLPLTAGPFLDPGYYQQLAATGPGDPMWLHSAALPPVPMAFTAGSLPHAHLDLVLEVPPPPHQEDLCAGDAAAMAAPQLRGAGPPGSRTARLDDASAPSGLLGTGRTPMIGPTVRENASARAEQQAGATELSVASSVQSRPGGPAGVKPGPPGAAPGAAGRADGEAASRGDTFALDQGAASNGAAQADLGPEAGEGKVPAHVWVPSTALLEAFKIAGKR